MEKNINSNEDSNIIPHKCQVCGMGDIEFIHDICKFCGWENDDVKDNEPDYFGGANRMSLNQYKQFWQEKSQEILKATNTCFTAIELAREYYNEHFKEQNEETLRKKKSLNKAYYEKLRQKYGK